MKKYRFTSFIFITTLILGCKTVDLEENHINEVEVSNESTESKSDYSFTEKLKKTEDVDEISDEEFYTEQILKVNDVASAIVYIEPPEVVYSEKPPVDNTVLTGDAALKQNLKDITVYPQYAEGRLKGWSWKEGQIYQVHTQTYRSTIIQLEPGEEMLEVPYISEPDVWRLSRGVGIKDGKDTQFLIIKPDYSGLTSTLIIITNYRVYQMELKSYKDHYMPYVKWIYPQAISDDYSWTKWQERKQNSNSAVLEFTGSNIEYCSFDYKITHPLKRPVWCPELVYDDGKFTYIVLDKTALMTEMPTIFLGSRKIVNTQVHKNIIVVNQLIEKATLRLGKAKVTIQKKKSK